MRLAPLKAGGPLTLTISGTNKLVVSDILVGEVWIAGGQSNMERQLGLRAGQQPIDNWEKEVAAATHPQIRHFGVAQVKSLTPLATVKGAWAVCSPDTVKDFTAVGYFFARDLERARNVPIGIIHSSWGGTPAEAWTSEAGLRTLPEFADVGAEIKTLIADPEAARRAYEAKLEIWFAANDSGSVAGKLWSDPALDAADWKTMTLPTLWEDAGEPDLNGVVWFRKTFDSPGQGRERRRRAAARDGRRHRHHLGQRREGRRHRRLQRRPEVRRPRGRAQARAQRRRRARARHRRRRRHLGRGEAAAGVQGEAGRGIADGVARSAAAP